MRNNDALQDYILTPGLIIGGALVLQDAFIQIVSEGLTINSGIGVGLGATVILISLSYIHDIRDKVRRANRRKSKLSSKVDELRDYKRVLEALDLEKERVEFVVQNGDEVKMRPKA